ncbi:MAG: DUF3623 domain-containing protein [Rhodoferax sp.]|nr:DUF3623 domain-containing protein [Rhodoferax sp.]
MPEYFSSIAGAVITALISWWLGTGAILWLVRLPARRFKTSMTLLTQLWLASVLVAAWSMRDDSVLATYAGFVSVIVMWGWHELAFLSGWITGPRTQPLDEGATGWRRFQQSVLVLLYHELALVANFLLLWLMQLGQPNPVALCTFGLLWCMRLSSKLNLYFGVPHLGEQYLPDGLGYLASYFRRSRVTACFYLTMVLSSGAWLWLVFEVQRGAMGVTTSWTLLATLLGLAIVEHLLMAFSMPLQRLWGWALNTNRSPPGADLPALPAVLPRSPGPR